MQLHNLQPKTPRVRGRRVGRGGKRGTYSGKGWKGQKSRSGAGIKPGFRGGDNRIWQLFPKQRGASKKPGNARVHVKHRFYQKRNVKPAAINLDVLNVFEDGNTVTPAILRDRGLVDSISAGVKVLGGGDLKVKLNFKDIDFSESALTKIQKMGGSVINE